MNFYDTLRTSASCQHALLQSKQALQTFQHALHKSGKTDSTILQHASEPLQASNMLCFIQNGFSHPLQPSNKLCCSQIGLYEPLKASNSHCISQNGLHELLRYSTNLCKPPTRFAAVKTSSTNILTRFAQVRQNGLYNPSTCFRTSTSIQHALFYSKRILPSSTTLQQALL